MQERICKVCTMVEAEDEAHYMLRCPVYYEIWGRFHCLFQEGFGPLAQVMQYEDQEMPWDVLARAHMTRMEF